MPVRELHHPHRLAVALRIGHAEVPARPLLQVAALLVPDQRDRAALELADPGHDRVVVHPAAIAVQLEEVVEDPLDVVERVRPLLVARELDALPDLLVRGVVLEPLELALQALELGREPRPAQELDPAQLGQPVAEAELGVVRHAGLANSRISCATTGRAARCAARSGRCGRSGGSTRRGRSRPGASRASSGRRRAGRRTTSARRARRASTSPSEAKLASRPPVVGWVSTEIITPPDSCSSSSAQTVFGSCISARIPSCMRAPPEEETETSGSPPAAACSQARANFSPTTLPIEPPMNEKSITASRHGSASIRAVPVIIASPRPVETSASARRSVYGLRSKKSSGSPERRRHLVLREAALVGQLLDPLAALDREVVAALRADAQVRLQLLVAVVRTAVGTGVRVLLRRPVVERGLLVLDRDVDLVGGGHLRHLRPASPKQGYRPAAAARRTRAAGSASSRNPVSPRPGDRQRARRCPAAAPRPPAPSAHPARA